VRLLDGKWRWPGRSAVQLEMPSVACVVRVRCRATLAAAVFMQGILAAVGAGILRPRSVALSSFSDEVRAERGHGNILAATSPEQPVSGRAGAPKPRHRNLLPAGGNGSISLLPFYHTTDEVQAVLLRLRSVGGCPGAEITVSQEQEDGVSLDVVRLMPHVSPASAGVISNHTSDKTAQRVFLLFGEHARELISPELGLFFVRLICADPQLQKVDPSLQSKAVRLLAGPIRVEYMIVVNANPISRRKVEAGAWCLRVNERGVDLNRNWGIHRDSVTEKQRTDPDEYEGPSAFSEPQTRIVKRLVEAFKPVAFVSLHSGTFMLGTPAAYTSTFPSIPMPNGLAMLDVLKPINEQYCQCPYGPVGIAVGYESAGTCLDYVYEKEKVPFSFIWEIFTDDAAELHGAWRQSSSWLEDAQTKQRWAGTPVSLDRVSLGTVLLQNSTSHRRNVTLSHRDQSITMTPEQCLRTFNPVTESEYEHTVRSWSRALLDLSENVNAYMPGGVKALTETAARTELKAQQAALKQPLHQKLGAIRNRYADLYKKLGLKHHR